MKISYLIFLCILLTIISMSLFSWTNARAQSNVIDYYAGKEPAGRPLHILAQEYWENYWVNESNEPKSECMLGHDTKNTTIFLYNPYQVDYDFKCDKLNISDKYLLIPLMPGECDETIPDSMAETWTIEQYWQCGIDANEKFASWNVTLDNQIIFKKPVEFGDKVAKLIKTWDFLDFFNTLFVVDQGVNSHLKEEILVRNAPPFNLTVPKNETNKYPIPPGTHLAVVDGYYFPVIPLKPGEHVLEYEVLRIPSKGTTIGDWDYGKVRYWLNVTK